MSQVEFERHVIDSLGRLETSMQGLVGSDGNGGWKNDIETRMRSQERRRWKEYGFVSAITAIIGAVASAVASYWRHG